MLGKVILALPAFSGMFGPFIADFNETHVLNPRWPPHARFHNGQTMSTGVLVGLATLYYAFRPVAKSQQLDSLTTAAFFGSIYWVAGLSAILYPGALAIDPEFGEGNPQLYLFSVLLALTWIGWLVEKKVLALDVGKTA